MKREYKGTVMEFYRGLTLGVSQSNEKITIIVL